jgi:hypothetical protein
MQYPSQIVVKFKQRIIMDSSLLEQSRLISSRGGSRSTKKRRSKDMKKKCKNKKWTRITIRVCLLRYSMREGNRLKERRRNLHPLQMLFLLRRRKWLKSLIRGQTTAKTSKVYVQVLQNKIKTLKIKYWIRQQRERKKRRSSSYLSWESKWWRARSR